MSQTFEAVAYRGARRIKYYDGRTPSEEYSTTRGFVGWYYTGAVNLVSQTSYDVAIEIGGEIPDKIEPIAEDTSTFELTVGLGISFESKEPISDIVNVAVKDTTFSGSDASRSRYDAIRLLGDNIGNIQAGSRTVSFVLTREQADEAIGGSVFLFPKTEFRSVQNIVPVFEDFEEETKIVYTPINSAAKGRASDFTPGQQSSVVLNDDVTVRYIYHHDFGGYSQAFLSVIAKNQDTGEVVTICKKKSVSVRDGGEGTFTIPGNSLSAGQWTLTICAAPANSANYYGDTSEFWTEGQELLYTIRINPVTSSVSCDGRPIPEVSWESVSQAAYQVRLGDYDSGARVGAETSFIVPRIFPDGAYPVQVRTASSAGAWSDWTEVEYVTIQNTAPSGSFSAQAVQDGANIRLNWSAFSGVSRYAVFRDGKMIGVVGSGVRQFVDRIGAGGQYEVLAVTSARYYKASGQIAGRLMLSADLLSTDGGYTWMAGKYTPDRKNQPEDVREDVSFVYYAGREKPVAYRTRQRSRTKSFVYVFKNRIPARRLRELVGSEVIVKTTRGEHIRGVIPEMSWGDARFVSPSFQIREIWGEEDGLEYPTE